MIKVKGSRTLAAIPVATGLAVLAYSLGTGAAPAAAFEAPSGQLHIVKDCSGFSGMPGSSYCTIVISNLAQLPVGTRIYYDQITGGPSVPGPSGGYLDSNIFVYFNDNQWAVGRCTVTNNNVLPLVGICTLSDGFGVLAGFSARVDVAWLPGGDGMLYTWNGTYSFSPLP
jgi:hypothetical protein